ncbi:hypothetical protein BKA69DRAFT_1077744 [Paraphysoderma sedebokerense]|nr:hypothetical protein BKA69DRAFT_1077713 [Paraphysoderma sedebokerense]KAI9140796.1 hypothetical protein BKA69DRAFT_1077744 [Paraphysoderma sedebokerense]
MQLDRNIQGNIGDFELSSVAQVIIFHDITQIVEYRKRLEESQEELKSLTVERTDMLLWLCHELRNPIHVVSSTLAEISQVIGKLHQVIDSKVDIDEQMRSASYAFDYVTSIVDDILEYVGVGIKQSIWGVSQFSHGVLLENIMQHVRKEVARLSEATNVHYSLSIISDLPHNAVSSLRVNESDEADWITKLLIQLSKLSIQVCHSGSSVFASVAVSSTENDYRLEIVHHIQHASANSLPEIIANCKPFSTSQSTQGALFGAPGLKVSLIQKCLQQNNQDSQSPPSLRVKENRVADGGISLVLSTTLNLKSITHAPFTIIDMTAADNIPLTPTSSLESLDWSSSTPPPTILIVEDNLLVQRIAQKMVKKLGYKVVLANDGVQAVECVEKSLSSDSKVDLILMDLIMPNMSGDEATEKIRNELHLTSTQLPIIACTANALETERKRCLDSGLFNNFITKPIKPEQLKAIIESYLGPSPREE